MPSSMNILIIGGTRNIGFFLARRLIDEGHRLTILNRGITPDDLPDRVARLRCDRTDHRQLKRALNGREFDMVVDFAAYKGVEAESTVDILRGQVGHYVFISTGQVYLVREGVRRPYTEDDYDGPILPAPEPNTYDYEEWLYGQEKRRAEDVLANAHEDHGFPYTALRLPMVNSERDAFNRLYNYVLRIRDGGPILIPDAPQHSVRNIYAGDVVEAIMKLLGKGRGEGRAYNISQDESLPLIDFLHVLAEVMNTSVDIEAVPRDVLKANGFLPDCSPFSEAWMSELDNTRSKQELGMIYTPLREYLGRIVTYYEQHPPGTPASYRRRHAEKNLLISH